MRTFYLIGVFTFFCFQIGIAQYDYNKQWEKVENYELDGRVKSANKVVQKIYKKADKEQNTAQLVKSFIYSSKFSLVLDEEAEQLVFERLETEIVQQSFPTNAILENIYADFLFQYYKKHRYKIQSRSAPINDSLPSDYRVWDTKTFISEIHQRFQSSIKQEEALQKLSSEDYALFLKGITTKRAQRPTLYDVLTQSALSFYNNKALYSYSRKYIKANEAPIFEVDSSFLQYDFSKIASQNNYVTSGFQLFQKLEKLHQNNIKAYIPVVLARLEFAKWHSGNIAPPIYLKALEQFANRFEGNPQTALIQYEIANFCNIISTEFMKDTYPNYKEYRKRAHTLVQQTIAEYPNSEGALKCKILKKNIEKKTITLKMESYSVPNKPSLANVHFKNIDTLFLKAYRIPKTFLKGVRSHKHDSIIANYIKNIQPILQKNYAHKIPQDFYNYTIEISVPELSKGDYLITLSDKNSNDKDSKVLTYTTIKKTNLTVFTTNLNTETMYTVVNRETGIPIHNAKITVFDDKKIIDQRLFTDHMGNATIRKRDGKRRITEYVSFENDTLYTKNNYLGNAHKKKTDSRWNARPFVFMDRSIYRPGQTIYFKGILLQQKNGESSVVPNVYCNVTIESPDNELKTFRLKTNEFGTFSDSFRLPKNAETGEYLIVIDEDEDYEEDEHPFWDFVDDFESIEHEFQVEEYKRPRFELTLDEFKDHVTFNDSVQIKGTAKALLGSYVSDATVNYTIKRNTNILYEQRNKYGYYNQTDEIFAATTKTGKKGKFTIPFKTVENTTVEREDLKSYSYTVNIEVIDINGEIQTTEKTIKVGSKNFLFDIIVPNNHDVKTPLKTNIIANDLNDVPVFASGEVKIYKLKSPNRVLRKRPWSLPSTQLIPKEEFIAQFPHEQYDKSESHERYWKKGLQVAHLTFNTLNEKSVSVDVDTWKSGKYVIESYGINEQRDSIFSKKTITLTNTEDQYLADNKIFRSTVLNSAFTQDGFVELKLVTAIKNDVLPVYVQAFYKEKLVYNIVANIDKGSKVVRIPIQPTYKDEITIRIQYTKYNSFDENSFDVTLNLANKLLTIETLSFRNKLLPGQKETWRFNILDPTQKINPTEVLASMYDESLDQFAIHEWNPRMNRISRNYYNTPRFNTNSFKTSNSRFLYNEYIVRTMPNFGPALQFDWFGLDFNMYKYKNGLYLKRLIEKKKRIGVKTGNIGGFITDDTGLPLPGATVKIKGTEIGITTDFDGLFTIHASPNDILEVSYVGFTTEEVLVGNKGNINVMLQSDNSLGAVVITAYGIKRKSNITSSIVTVNGKSINQVPTASIEQILQGQAAGLNIQTNSGQVGTSGTILLRGRNSVQGNKEPLFIIDGVPVDENAFKNFNQDNITSINILKDGSGVALYGNSAANGVIIITTKYGTKKEIIDGLAVIVGITEEDINTVETRKKLDETAFFYPHLRTDSEGNVAIEFDTPEALTRWKLQLLAHQKDGSYGMIEKTAVTQKELMVVPNMPRFLREKDTIVISTKVVNLNNEKSKGIASLRLFNALTMETVDDQIHLEDKNKAFTIDAKGNAIVSWKLYIPEGLDAIQYKVIAKAGKFSDGEESALPVLKNSILITEAKPIWVKAGEEKTITFSKLANNKSTSLKQHKLTLEYTSNPTWNAIQSLPYLLEYPYECAEQTFARLYANILVTHILKNSPEIKEVFDSWKENGALLSDLEKNSELKTLLIQETPWVRDAASETEKKQRLLQLFDTNTLESQLLELITKLYNLQGDSGGFPWFAGGNENMYITLHILNSYAHLQNLGIAITGNDDLDITIEYAVKYIDKQFLERYVNHSKNPAITNYRSQVQYLYTRSAFMKQFKPSKEVQKGIDFYSKGLENDWLTLSIKEKATLAMTLHRFGNTKVAKKIMTSLAETAVETTENGMYWKELTNKRFYNTNAVEVQALLIEAFSEIMNDDDIVTELQLWLLQQKQTSQWATTKATTKAIYALLLNPKKFVSIKDNTVFTIGSEKIKTKKLAENEKEAGTGYFKTSWNTTEITPDKATIKVKNKSKTVGYGGVYWQYFEKLENVTQNDEASLQVTKELYISKHNTGKVLTPVAKSSLKIGDLITVRLTIKNKKDIEFIHLKDMRAASLEPINVFSEYKWKNGLGYYESTRDASTNFFFDKIPKGIFTIEYEVRVNNMGDFSNGITTIESMYAPEFRSHTKGIRIKVK